jgi:hypothetical protein
MPKATVDPSAERFDLKTCPGGYVELRTLNFHEMEVRKDIMGRVYREARVDTPGKGRRKQAEDEVMRAYFESMNVAVTEFEFRNCITEHNLYVDEAETQLIDFTKPMHTWKLNPKIGQEISEIITRLTQIDEEEDMSPLGTAPSSSSLDEESVSTISTIPTP